MTSTTAKARAARPLRSRLHDALVRLEAPTTTYYLLVIVTSTLVVFGLIMVLSASAVTSLAASESQSAFTIFRGQAVYAAIGTVALVLASRLPVPAWKRLSVPLFVIALGLQLLVAFIGTSVNGNRNWLRFGPVSIQPSELVKFGLVLFGAFVLTLKRDRLGQIGHVVVPFLVPGVATAFGLILIGGDLGTSIVVAGIVAAILFASGAPLRWFAAAGASFAAVALALIVTSPNRLARFDVWLGRDTDPFGAARQPMQGRYALADGGWIGLGLGASREKWQWLSEPHNDFIFAIIGEELGLPGTLMVLALFGVLAYACYRLVLRSGDFFVRLATAGAMAWIVVQALVNIGAVIGLLPVIGVPLPLVSSGGSSLITTMGVLGMLMSFARAEPGAKEALAGRPSILRRTAAVVPSVSVRRTR
ncbi:MAG: putative lipid II flippase FtsW [Actinobacteria bacterium]|nr:putative lipid II flippase FtsW [Actinomycetota bacterium]